jgi:acyl carrier protein
MPSIDDRYASILAPHLDPAHPGRPDPDTPLRELGVDSLGVVGLIADLEVEFDLEFPEAVLTTDTFRSPRSLLEVVRRLAADGQP